jgi:hypothetical protein
LTLERKPDRRFWTRREGLYVFRFAPREADVEKGRGVDWDWEIDGGFVDVGSLGHAAECKLRHEKDVERVEKADDFVRCLGMRRSDLEGLSVRPM